MKAIIEIIRPSEYAQAALEIARLADAGVDVPESDYRLGFQSAGQMFRELTPERLRTLETLKQSGAMSVYALAKTLGRNYSNVHRDIKALMDYGLVERGEDDKVAVPWESVEIRLTFGEGRAA